LNPLDTVVAKVTDFGVSENYLSSSSGRKVDCPMWLAPEVMRNETYTISADVYSYGIILWELVAKEKVFGELTWMKDVEAKVLNGDRPEIPTSCTSIGYRTLLRQCWHRDPGERPKFAVVVGRIKEIMKESFPGVFMEEKEKIQAPVKNWRVPVCVGCKLPINGKTLVAMKQPFHPECFLCYYCKQLLSSYFVLKGKFFCRSCYVRIKTVMNKNNNIKKEKKEISKKEKEKEKMEAKQAVVVAEEIEKEKEKEEKEQDQEEILEQSEAIKNEPLPIPTEKEEEQDEKEKE